MVALVTGGGRGIGQALALRLAAEGWQVAIAARSVEQLTQTVSLSGGKVFAAPVDVAEPASVKALVAAVEAQLGPVDLLINNAGIIGPLGPFEENDSEAWWHCMAVNVRGPMLTSQAIVPGMIARGHGRIINISSGAGNAAMPGASAYGLSKTALTRFSEQLAVELKPKGISVFPVRPGVVRTAMVDEARQAIPLIQKLLDDGVDVSTDVVADLILFLASGRADELSGHQFSVKEDVEEMLRRAEEIRRDGLYTLRIGQLGPEK